MPLYEHIFLGRQDISAQQFEALVETYQSIIKDNGGSIEKSEYWGIKNLAYKIKKNRKAHFALLNIDAPHEAVAEMERQMGISTDIIRFLTLRMDELESGPSAMMKRGDRDDRRGGRHDRDRGPRPDRPKPVLAPKKEAVKEKSADTSKADAKKAETSKTKDDKPETGRLMPKRLKPARLMTISLTPARLMPKRLKPARLMTISLTPARLMPKRLKPARKRSNHNGPFIWTPAFLSQAQDMPVLKRFLAENRS